ADVVVPLSGEDEQVVTERGVINEYDVVMLTGIDGGKAADIEQECHLIVTLACRNDESARHIQRTDWTSAFTARTEAQAKSAFFLGLGCDSVEVVGIGGDRQEIVAFLQINVEIACHAASADRGAAIGRGR